MPNIDALVGVREWARDQHKLALDGQPSEWDQKYWVARVLSREMEDCGTVCCIAGKTALDAGAVPLWEGEGFFICNVVNFHGVNREVDELAEELLGLTKAQSSALFCMSNKFKDVEYIINNIIADPEWSPYSDQMYLVYD